MAYSASFQSIYGPLIPRHKRSDAALKTYASTEDARAYSMDLRERADAIEEVVKGRSGESVCSGSESQAQNSKGVSDVDKLQKELKVFLLTASKGFSDSIFHRRRMSRSTRATSFSSTRQESSRR